MDLFSKALNYVGNVLSPDLEDLADDDDISDESHKSPDVQKPPRQLMSSSANNTPVQTELHNSNNSQNNNNNNNNNNTSRKSGPESIPKRPEKLKSSVELPRSLSEDDFFSLDFKGSEYPFELGDFDPETFGNDVWDIDFNLIENVKYLCKDPGAFQGEYVEHIINQISKHLTEYTEKKQKEDKEPPLIKFDRSGTSSNMKKSTSHNSMKSLASPAKARKQPNNWISSKGLVLQWSEMMEDHVIQILKEVPELEKLRYNIVPRFISEDCFWILYFFFFRKSKQQNFNLRNQGLYLTSTRLLPQEPASSYDDKVKFYKQLLDQGEMEVFDKSKKAAELLKDVTVRDLVQRKEKTFRHMLRLGVPDEFRARIWSACSGCEKFLKDNPHFHDQYLYESFGEDGLFGVEIDLNSIQMFFPVEFLSKIGCFYLNDQGFKSAKRIFSMILKKNRDHFFIHVSHPTLIFLLLHFQSEGEALASTLFLEQQYHFSKYQIFETQLYSPALVALAKRYIPQLYDKICKLHLDHHFAQEWFDHLYVSYFPFQTVLRIVDLYLASGPKILFRVILGLFQKILLDLLDTHSKEEFSARIEKEMDQTHDAGELIRSSYFLLKQDSLMNELFNVRNANLPISHVASSIVDKNQFGTMWCFLSPSYRIRKPNLLFSTKRDGFSLDTLWQKTFKESPLIFIVKSNSKKIFGAFVATPLEKTHRSSDFSGTGETFLFQLFPAPKKFHWTENNNYFVLLAEKFLQIGGAQRGLYLDDELNVGYSEHCPTFNNDPLNGSGRENERWVCLGVEVWTC